MKDALRSMSYTTLCWLLALAPAPTVAQPQLISKASAAQLGAASLGQPTANRPLRSIASPAAVERPITGRVTDESNNEGLPGVNIVVKGTTVGTVTDIDGNYRLSVPDDAETLVFSSVGYTTQEVAIGNQSTVDLAMAPDVQSLSEVVVVGYGTQMKRDVTGAIATVKAEELSNYKAAPSLDQALQGQAAGVQVTSSSGVPGAPTRVLIRGTNSISSGTEPLWIIDGMILSNQGGNELGGLGRSAGTEPQNPLATINPNDIESIEVLKDASATAIYGSRGANGVIIVTTKSGKSGQGTTDLSINYGITDVVRGPEEIGFVDGPTWLSLVDQARANRGLPEFEPNALFNDARDPTAVLDRSQIANTNWFDEALRQGSFIDVNLSTSNATEKSNYYLSANYRDDESILEGNRLRRYATRANVDFYPAKNFSVGSRISLSYTNNQRAPNGGAPSGNSNIAQGGYNMANSGALPILPIFHPTIRDDEGNPSCLIRCRDATCGPPSTATTTSTIWKPTGPSVDSTWTIKFRLLRASLCVPNCLSISSRSAASSGPTRWFARAASMPSITPKRFAA